jgi:hypothetical protein
MTKLSKKTILMLSIIGIAIILLIASKIQNRGKSQEEFLPTRDTAQFEGYANVEEFCTDLTSSQEYDDKAREESFYQECLTSYSL